jgi:hypothetical protein
MSDKRHRTTLLCGLVHAEKGPAATPAILEIAAHCATQKNSTAHVRFGSKADIQSKKHDVRFTPKSGH